MANIRIAKVSAFVMRLFLIRVGNKRERGTSVIAASLSPKRNPARGPTKRAGLEIIIGTHSRNKGE